jgi:hydrogenase maturation protein HypF
MKKILETNPGIIACDLHPDYVSSRFAEASEAFHTKIQVQHHHAHIVSCMAENGVEGPVIGLAFDGTGYGTDGNIWGGEVFTATCGEFSRKAHLAYMPMPGGDAAAKEPWRMGISYLYDALGMAMMGRDIPMLASAFQQGVTKISGPEKVAFLIRMIDKKVNCPLTSSMGRLFDAVASITGLCHINTFDGQAAARLEMAAKKEAEGVYPYPDIESFLTGEGLLVINCRQIIRGIADDIENQVNVGLISRKFHRTVSRLFTEVCTRLRSETGINTVAMSGGVFQNITLSAMLESDLKKEGFEVCFHKQLPPNDGGLSLGQAVIAAERVNQGEKCH